MDQHCESPVHVDVADSRVTERPITSRRVVTLKKTAALLLVLIAVMWLTTFTQGQELAAPIAITLTSTYDSETAELVQTYRSISALSAPERRNFFRTSSAREKSNAARLHLALQLVRRPHLRQQQVQIILGAISLSSVGFFAAVDGTPAEKTRANDALKSLARRAHGILPLNEAELFANIGEDKAEDEILKKYTDISALPLSKRKAVFRNASSKDKSDLWKTHLALFLVKRPELNEWQRETVLAAMSLATPNWFDVKSGDTAWKAKVGDLLRDLEARILAAFSLEEGARIFATLGDSTESAKRTPTSTRSILLTSIDYKWSIDSGAYNPWASSRFVAQDLELERSSCQCSTQSDWCPIGGFCQGGNNSCAITTSGCGTLWSYPCDGASCQ